MITSVINQYGDTDNPSVVTGFKVIDDGVGRDVPKDDDNRHYREILQWVADGNTIAEPA